MSIFDNVDIHKDWNISVGTKNLESGNKTPLDGKSTPQRKKKRKGLKAGKDVDPKFHASFEQSFEKFKTVFEP